MPIPLTPQIAVSPQITPEDIPALAAHGFTTIINNRPDDEVPAHLAGPAIAAAAHAAGLQYTAIPVDHTGIGPHQLAAMAAALGAAPGPVLAYCRSGTRSTHLWALAQASTGVAPMILITSAEAAGYDIAPLAGTLRQLADSER